MSEDNLALLLKYPLISSEIRDGSTHYRGIIPIKNFDQKIHIISKNGNFELQTDFKNEKIAEISAPNIVEFLDKITATLEASQTGNANNRVQVYRKLLHEYSELVKFHVKINHSRLSADLSKIEIKTNDEKGRQHLLEIAVENGDESAIYRPVNVDLPPQFSKDFEKNHANLMGLYGKFQTAIEDLQAFFDCFDDLDRNCCVLDPEKPSRRDCYRRIWLGLSHFCPVGQSDTVWFLLIPTDQSLSMMVTLDPLNVNARPDLKFLGPERLILQYREKLNRKLQDWDEKTDLIEGLLMILEIDAFPIKPQTNRDTLMESGECSICFSLRYNDKLPEVVCANKSCENFYHVECLYEWLTSIDSKRSFNQIQGQCPNCEKGISCPLPEVFLKETTQS